MGNDIKRLLAGSAVVALVASSVLACRADDPAPTLRIVSPAADQAVAVPFEVVVESSVPLGAPGEEGMHHVHIWFGDDEAAQTIGESATVTVTTAPNGGYEMHVSLRHADHRPAGAETSLPLMISGGTRT